ncbi:MAG: alpha-1,2-fucosyltransferase [Candidatus Omnitrophica bacterium]|nr:alpha-1,2-fucosyltransferase [Candidatus Omnitrophota bacterium]
MIVVRLCGGLGNQLFQYAAARSLSERLQTAVKLDTTWFHLQQDRNFMIDVFHIKADMASEQEISTFHTSGRTGFWPKLHGMLTNKKRTDQTYFQEEHFHVNPDFFHLNNSVYLDGYWQSEKYFENIKEQLRNELTYKKPSTDENKDMLAEISSTKNPTVSLHIRRGDYVKDPRITRVLYSCQLDYYHKAVETIAQKVSNPFFYVFSDDVPWCHKHLRLHHAYKVISHNPPGQEWEDFRLMTACQHHITANSSFSWWGAWLDHTPQKIIISPLKWFKNKNYNDKDLIPSGWIRI